MKKTVYVISGCFSDEESPATEPVVFGVFNTLEKACACFDELVAEQEKFASENSEKTLDKTESNLYYELTDFDNDTHCYIQIEPHPVV